MDATITAPGRYYHTDEDIGCSASAEPVPFMNLGFEVIANHNLISELKTRLSKEILIHGRQM